MWFASLRRRWLSWARWLFTPVAALIRACRPIPAPRPVRRSPPLTLDVLEKRKAPGTFLGTGAAEVSDAYASYQPAQTPPPPLCCLL